MTTKGLNALIYKMEQLQKAVAALDGDLAKVRFDPHDPGSIERAIQQMETAIDERIGEYHNNEMVQRLADELKERGRSAILERAAAARLEGNEE
jgi:hypothetical protein